METVRIAYAGGCVVLAWDPAQADAPIFVDGVAIGCQTADARRRTDAAVRLACRHVWGPVYETAADHAAHGWPQAPATIWSAVTYKAIAPDTESRSEPDRP